MKISLLGTLMILLNVVTAFGQNTNRWRIDTDGSIVWNVGEDIPHYDHVEMSGEFLSSVMRYGVNDDGSFSLERTVIWPMLRTIPNDTHGSLTKRFSVDFMRLLVANNSSLKSEKVKSMRFNGYLTVVSEYAFTYRDLIKGEKRYPAVEVTRKIFPSPDKPVFCEQYSVKNITDSPMEIMIPEYKNVYHTDAGNGVDGSYTIVVELDALGTETLQPGEKIEFGTSFQAFSTGKGEHELAVSVETELTLREQFISKMWDNLVLETPDEVINREFAFSKIRASESIYRTAGGLMHGPGGERYYAAIWANDESEYVAPFFPFLGYKTANDATLNAFRLYMKYMNPDYVRVPSSIIAEGTDVWQAAGDCGDAAMLAYGGTRYALTRGDMEEAQYIWPLMEWSLEYCNRNLNEFGVVKSDADELEGRFPSGEANILVSSLYYDALVSATYLARDLKLPASQVAKYRKQAQALNKAIESYFGANVEGFETYSYYKGNTVLRSWICAPLFAGIQERAKATADALFSRLWTRNGLLSQSGSDIFWDRSTLSALRAVYVAGETEKATRYLKEYSHQRLLGDHVPYPIEAWPEGNQRHLSGESALYCRIITEGMFGVRPTGLRSFSLTPRLPLNWGKMELRHVKGFGGDFDILVSRENGNLHVVVKSEAKIITQKNIKEGAALSVKLD
ncbi:hypothetical protein [Maribellus sp. YY47]|uniref:hypothetical protein n=1 Tax=Maribellus sp. YY47 TaxID=2929486 RepID=UPI002000D95C|nr:hypothetical protein [Maribellus sp. YY47]MCK3685554.1 hypothetical protein [Maribellus sp. YY47]